MSRNILEMPTFRPPPFFPLPSPRIHPFPGFDPQRNPQFPGVIGGDYDIFPDLRGICHLNLS